MFSKAALRAGALAPVLKTSLQSRAALVLATRNCSAIKKHVDNWDKANKTYYGPERDNTNFPIKQMPETSPPVRLGFIPEGFFQMFYEKTGVTGPYMFGAGVVTYLLSSETWVIEHGFSEFVAFWIAIGIVLKKLGPSISKTLDASSQEYRELNWDKPLQATREGSTQMVTQLQATIDAEEGQKFLYEAKKENVDLQLEKEYRQRLAQVHGEVKKRLDYQLAKEVASRQFEQKHMVDWIVNNVTKSITPQQEKDSISRCIQDLKALSLKA